MSQVSGNTKCGLRTDSIRLDVGPIFIPFVNQISKQKNITSSHTAIIQEHEIEVMCSSIVVDKQVRNPKALTLLNC